MREILEMFAPLIAKFLGLDLTDELFEDWHELALFYLRRLVGCFDLPQELADDSLPRSLVHHLRI